MTGRKVDQVQLASVFERIARVPLYLNQIILHMVVGITSDPWDGLRRWQHEIGETGLREQWLRLKPIDRIILQHWRTTSRRACSVRTSAPWPLIDWRRTTRATPAGSNRRQSTGEELALAPKGEKGEYEIEDRALATYLASGPIPAR